MKEVDGGSKDWRIYKQLAAMYILKENYQAAADAMSRYPLFKSKERLYVVSTSNKACTAGDLLYSRGAIEKARPFYQLSADLDTGSSMSLRSHENLAILDRDFMTVLDYSLRRAQRYDSASAYGRYMTYLHLTGQHEVAWSLFNTLLGRYKLPQIWTSAMVGHRIQSTDPEKLIAWLRNVAQLNDDSRKRSYPARFGLLCMIDRPPNPALVKAIDDVDDLSSYNFKSKSYYTGPDLQGLGPSPKRFFPAEFRDPKNPTKPPKPPSFYGSFAQAYDLMKQGDFEKAYNLLVIRAWYYSYSKMYWGSSFKSYLIWAGIKAGKVKDIDRYFRMVESPDLHKEPDFDYELALAAYKGGTGHTREAIGHLKKAFAIRPASVERPLFSWYQIVELCEWLYYHSGDKRYSALALKWSRSCQAICPCMLGLMPSRPILPTSEMIKSEPWLLPNILIRNRHALPISAKNLNPKRPIG